MEQSRALAKGLNGYPLASAGEELDVSFVRGGGFANPEWGLTLREPGGRLRLLAYNGVFTEQRYEVLSSPFSIEFTEICSTESSCYTEETGLSVTVASLTDRVSLSLLERGSIMLEDEDYQVLLFGAGRNGDVTGNCSDVLSSGDVLYLVVLPAAVPY